LGDRIRSQVASEYYQAAIPIEPDASHPAHLGHIVAPEFEFVRDSFSLALETKGPMVIYRLFLYDLNPNRYAVRNCLWLIFAIEWQRVLPFIAPWVRNQKRQAQALGMRPVARRCWYRDVSQEPDPVRAAE
jgi:hypothetical protein